MDRETISIKTPKGHDIILYSYITGFEERAIRNVYLEKLSITVDGKLKDFDPTLAGKAEDKAIELVVVSIDGISENKLDTILGLPADEYKFIVDKINEITTGKKN